MKILFYDTQNYDRESFDRTKEQFPEIEVEYLKTGLAARTASLAKGYDAVCAFVNSDVGTKTVEALHEAGVKLILMRCAGFNNVDLNNKYFTTGGFQTAEFLNAEDDAPRTAAV